jgi:glycosyltransferase involved in cell wall biosynthesis
MKNPPSQYDVVMTTKDRPEDIIKTLESIVKQTILPQTIIIADASTADLTKKNIVQFQNKHPEIKIMYIKSPVASTTYQRNRAIERTASDIVYLIDDDVVIYPDHAAKTLKFFREDPTVDAIIGVEIDHPKPTSIYKFYTLIFNLDTQDDKRPSAIKASGFRRLSINSDRILPSPFMDTCCSAIKSKILIKHPFDENLGGYGFMEDLDFSIPIGRSHKILCRPELRYHHSRSQTGRISERVYQTKFVFNHYYVYKKHLSKNRRTIIPHCWSHVGIVLDALINAVKYCRCDIVLGTMNGYGFIFRHLLTGKCPDESEINGAKQH